MNTKFYLLTILINISVLFTACSSGSGEQSPEYNDNSASLAGKKYEYLGSYEHEYTFTFGDALFQKMNNAIYFVPRDKYEASWTYADTLLTTHEITTKQIVLSFESNVKAKLTENTQSNVNQQRAKVYHHYYKFKEDFYTENGLYMASVKANSFAVYDKTTNRRYDFRLDGNYGYNLNFYMKNGLTTQDVITNTNNYEFTYIYDQESYSVDFSDDNGNIAYGFIEKYDNVTGFALYLNGKTYLLKE